MHYLLFPGRHLAHTKYQEQYLRSVLQSEPSRWRWRGKILPFAEKISCVVWAITSANQQNSRYNPTPFYLRAIGVDRFAEQVGEPLGCKSRLMGIPHFPPTEDFARRLVVEIKEQSEGELTLLPENTVVLCSTPSVMEQFLALGYAVLPAEDEEEERPPTPVDVVRRLAEGGKEWEKDEWLEEWLSPTTRELWLDYPELTRRVVRLFRDPLLNEQGNLTATRDYLSYAQRMSNPAVIEFKYRDIQAALVEGKIVDEGCADGALLVPIAKDFPDSDLMGIELTSEFLAQCRERQRRGDFGGAYVFFHQRNLLEDLFEPNSINTTLCNSTTHELWSYGDGEPTLRAYLARKYQQTAPGGRLVIRDVVGPEEMEQEVYLWCRTDDGSNEAFDLPCASDAELEQHLRQLSTAARFRRFALDFLAAERATGRRGAESEIRYRQEVVEGTEYFVLRLKDAAEFLSKKDYLDNWRSELHEEFTFWSFSQWKQALREAGFRVLEDALHEERGSRAYVNEWIVEHRYRGKVGLFVRREEGWQAWDFPVTNMVLVGEKGRGD